MMPYCTPVVFHSGSLSKANTSPAASQFFNQQDAVKRPKHTLKDEHWDSS